MSKTRRDILLGIVMGVLLLAFVFLLPSVALYLLFGFKVAGAFWLLVVFYLLLSGFQNYENQVSEYKEKGK